MAQEIKILLVEDEPDIREMIIFNLESRFEELEREYRIDEAENGKEGLETALAGEYDLILTDMHMPVMDGHEMVKILREKGYTNLIVAVTASAMVTHQKESIDSGCDEFIIKPVVSPDFENRVIDIWENRKMIIQARGAKR